MAFFTSVFLREIKGFNMGVMMESDTAIALSMGLMATGLTYKNVHGTKNMTTTVRWEPQVERALPQPSELQDFREQRMTT